LYLCAKINHFIVKLDKNTYLHGFVIVVFFLALVRLIIPSVAESKLSTTDQKVADAADSSSVNSAEPKESVPKNKPVDIAPAPDTSKPTKWTAADGSMNIHKVMSVPGFSKSFPDSNSVQLISAQRFGVPPVMNRADAGARKKELVYIGSNPYYYIDKLHNSIPYLVPRAAVLLQDIGKNFFDSLVIKGIPLHKIIVTSVLRTQEDVSHLRTRNGNATQNSCHLYGTTFDVCYNRYRTVEDPEGPARRKVRNDTLKWVLSEVLRDMRVQNRCYIKYEVHQGCFHLTVR
jgi:hypothetical protein